MITGAMAFVINGITTENSKSVKSVNIWFTDQARDVIQDNRVDRVDIIVDCKSIITRYSQIIHPFVFDRHVIDLCDYSVLDKVFMIKYDKIIGYCSIEDDLFGLLRVDRCLME